MTEEFASIRNYHERAVFDAIRANAPTYPFVADPGLLADVACVALNRLMPRYIRHEVDLAFYLTDKERGEMAHAVEESVRFAFEFVQARKLLKARV